MATELAAENTEEELKLFLVKYNELIHHSENRDNNFRDQDSVREKSKKLVGAIEKVYQSKVVLQLLNAMKNQRMQFLSEVALVESAEGYQQRLQNIDNFNESVQQIKNFSTSFLALSPYYMNRRLQEPGCARLLNFVSVARAISDGKDYRKSSGFLSLCSDDYFFKLPPAHLGTYVDGGYTEAGVAQEFAFAARGAKDLEKATDPITKKY